MTAYFIYLFIITVQWGFICVSQKKITVKSKKNYLIIACAELIILAGVRGHGVGADVGTYLSAFDYYLSFPKSERLFVKSVYLYDFEIGYSLLTRVCAWLEIGHTGFLFLIAIITYVPIFIAIYKYSPMPYISILTYFAFGLFGYSLGIFRQMIAISIILCGLKFIINRQFWKYLLVVIFAMMFHMTALLALALYFAYPIKWRTNAMIGIVGCVVAAFCGRTVILTIIRLFPSYSSYVGSIYDITDNTYIMIFVLLILWGICCLQNKKQQITRVNKIAFDALSFSLIVQNLGYHMGAFGRIIGYFSIFYIFLIPGIVNIFDKKSRVIANMGLIVVLLLMIIIQLSDAKIQYVTVWN